MPSTFLNDRRQQQRQERQAAAEISAARQAGSMTRGERDALRRRPILVPSPWGGTPYTDPIKAGIKAHRRTVRATSKAARRSQKRGR
jgi:hypothetical protein